MFALALILASASATFSGAQPQLAALGERVFVAFAAGDVISVARSADGGRTFGSASPLATAGKLSLGGHRGPRIAVTEAGVLVSAVAGHKGGGADGDVILYRSIDGGATWTAPRAINDAAGAAREGLHAMAAAPGGLAVIAWLDLRDGGTRIYAAISRDHGASWSADQLVYASPSGRICECCHPSVAIDRDGRVAIMFRNNVDGYRDMFVTRSTDARTFGPATKLGTGSWRLAACPMDGGALAWDGPGLVAAWRREDGVFLSTASVPERRLGTGRDPVVGQSGPHTDVAWTSPAGIMLARDGSAPAFVFHGRFPALLALAHGTVLAWEDGGTVRVQTIPR